MPHAGAVAAADVDAEHRLAGVAGDHGVRGARWPAAGWPWDPRRGRACAPGSRGRRSRCSSAHRAARRGSRPRPARRPCGSATATTSARKASALHRPASRPAGRTSGRRGPAPSASPWPAPWRMPRDGGIPEREVAQQPQPGRRRRLVALHGVGAERVRIARARGASRDWRGTTATTPRPAPNLRSG